MDREAQWATVRGVAYSWTQLSTCVCKKDGEKRKDWFGTRDPGNNIRMSSRGFLFEDPRLGAEKVHSLGMAMAAD